MGLAAAGQGLPVFGLIVQYAMLFAAIYAVTLVVYFATGLALTHG